MELRHLRYFIAVAEELHFGHAAARLHIAQPPLSQQIRQLEEELGVQLLNRTKRRVQLTAVGQVFLEEARRTLAQAEQAVRAAQRAHRGEIGRLLVGFVGSATGSLLPEILRAFRTRFPDVELVLQEMTTVQQVQALHAGRLHLGFVRPPIDDATLALEVLLQEPLMVAFPEGHALAMRRRIPLKALAAEPFVLMPRYLGPGLYDHIVSLCQRAGFSPTVAQEATQMQTIVGLVAVGIGVALVPASVQNLRTVGVIYRALQDPAPMTELALAWQRDEPSKVAHTFLSVARQVIAGEG